MERCGWQGGSDEHRPHHPQQQDPQPAQGLLQQPRCRRCSQVPLPLPAPSVPEPVSFATVADPYQFDADSDPTFPLMQIRLFIFIRFRIRPSSKWCLSETIFHSSTDSGMSLRGSTVSLYSFWLLWYGFASGFWLWWRSVCGFSCGSRLQKLMRI